MLYNLIFDFLRENIYDLIIYDLMAKQIGKTPYNLVKLDCDEIIDWDHINNLNENLENGVSLCLRSENGHPQRGGYFFHFIKDSTNTDKYTVYDFYKNKIIVFSETEMINFINHFSGRKFNFEIFDLCQKVINFRID